MKFRLCPCRARKTYPSVLPRGTPFLTSRIAVLGYPQDDGGLEVATQVRDAFKRTQGVVDVDWYVEDPQPQYRFAVDKEKASLNGVSTNQITQTLRMALSGAVVGIAHQPKEKETSILCFSFPGRSEPA